MISRKHVSVQTHLILSDDETEWLKGVLQNPLTNAESAPEEAMRNKFWNALDKETKQNEND